MKLYVRMISALLCMAMLMGLCTVASMAVPATVTGASKTDTRPIKLGNTDTGVSLTQMLLPKGSKYALSADALLNVVEVDLSEKVSLAVLNGGSYNWSKATMGASVVAYNKAHNDSTVLAAVNGDPWLVYHTDYDGDGVKATGKAVKHVTVSRGTMIIDGELWASHQIDDENNLARTDNVERGTPASRGPIFAIKQDGTAMIGIPTIGVSLVNATTDTTVKADGVNRLPAPNSIILYNHRCGTESFAYEDAYEIYLDCSDPAFSLSKSTSGKVIAIFESGDTSTRPAIDGNTVVISARGTSISRIKGQFKVGDTVGVTCSVTSDSYTPGQHTVWGEVKEAIGGFFTLVQKGSQTGQPGNATNYPCSIIGLKQDGTVIMTAITATEDGTRNACRMQDLPALCQELGYYTAILFDGGGSTTMVSLEGDSYVRRSSAVDGSNSVRSVINGIAVVYNGVDQEYANKEAKNTAFLPGLGIAAPEEPDLGGADLKVSPSYAYGYIAMVETINGTKYENLLGRRAAGYSSGWTTEEKAASIQPAVVNGVATTEDHQLILSGWAQVNGGQGTYYWSVDREYWYACTDGEFSEAEAAVTEMASSEGGLSIPVAANGRFANLTADLSDYQGETVTVYFAVAAAGNREKLLHYLTVENVAVPAAETEAPTEPETAEPVTDPATDAATELSTEPSTEAPTEPVTVEAPTDIGTPSETDTQPAKDGCSSVLSGGILFMLAGAFAACVAVRKRKE